MQLKKLSKRLNDAARIRRMNKITSRKMETQVTQEKDKGAKLEIFSNYGFSFPMYSPRRINYPIRNASIHRRQR
jgi:hypothetical protein